MDNPGLEHLADHIFQYLEAEDMANCRLVSTFWREYIDSHKHWWSLKLYHIGHQFQEKYSYDNGLCCECGCASAKYSIWTILTFGFVNKDFEVMKEFTSYMMEYYMKYRDSWYDKPDTVLGWAIRNNYKDFIYELPYRCIDLDETCANGKNPLHVAVETEDIEMVEIILKIAEWRKTDGDDYGFVNAKCHNKWGDPDYTALNIACLADNAEIVELFLKYADTLNIDVLALVNDWPWFREMNALHLAVKPFQYHEKSSTGKTLKLLLNYGKEKNFEDRDWLTAMITCDATTPFELACQHGAIEAVEVFLEFFIENEIIMNMDDMGIHPLASACKKLEDIKASNEILTEPQDFTEENIEYISYHEQTYDARLEIVKILIKAYKENGLDVKDLGWFADEDNFTALHHACSTGSTEIVKVLLENGYGDLINVQDYLGRTPLHHACWVDDYDDRGPAGYPDTVDFLLSKMEELGLNLTLKNEDGYTALQYLLNLPYPEEQKETGDKILAVFEKYGVHEEYLYLLLGIEV